MDVTKAANLYGVFECGQLKRMAGTLSICINMDGSNAAKLYVWLERGLMYFMGWLERGQYMAVLCCAKRVLKRSVEDGKCGYRTVEMKLFNAIHGDACLDVNPRGFNG